MFQRSWVQPEFWLLPWSNSFQNIHFCQHDFCPVQFSLWQVLVLKTKIRQYKEREKKVLSLCGIFKHVLTDNEMSEDISEGEDWYRYIDNIETKYMDIWLSIWICNLYMNMNISRNYHIVNQLYFNERVFGFQVTNQHHYMQTWEENRSPI